MTGSSFNLRRRGSALIWTTVVLSVLTAFCSLAVDVGRVQVVKTELRRTVDAAARYAAPAIGQGIEAVRARAKDAADDNKADGRPVILADSDIEQGRWNPGTRTFVPNGTPTDAIRVTARRAGADAVPLMFARMLGRNSFDVSAFAVMRFQPAAPVGIVGLDWVDLDSNARTDSYDSTVGPYNASWGPDRGHVYSNGNITLDSGSVIGGDANYGPGRSVSGGSVTGSRAALGSPMTPALVSAAPHGPSNNDNGNIPSGNRPGNNFSMGSGQTVNLPAGNYYFVDFRVGSGAVLNVVGPATVYVSGVLVFDSNSRTSAHRPGNLRFRMVGSGLVDFDANTSVYAQVEAPLSTVILDSATHFYGSILGKTLRLDANSRVHYDESLGTGGSRGTLSLVQ